ncbi:MAG TPA: class II aldolase/adducin family protein [Chloroflexota bacterium]|nr:class II aldolase/adducin family protein [Chloroflexota bacterium]
MATETELRQLLADACRIMARFHLVDNMGHPSARIPGTDRVLIKPRHSTRIRSQDRVTPDDMVVIDLDGKFLDGQDGPPSERFIHTCLYRARPEIQAVVHTHQRWSTIMSIGEAPIHPVIHVGSEVVQQPVPMWPHANLVTDAVMGDDMARCFGSSPVGLLQGHGITSVATTVQEAVVQAVRLEEQAEANWRVLAMGRQPRVIPHEEIQQRAATGVGWEVHWAYFREVAGCLS